MKQTRKYVGLARCLTCKQEFPMRSGVHTYCTPKCRPQTPHRRKGPRGYTCLDCKAEGRAGKSGPLPIRCEDCKRRWDCRPERLAKKREDLRRRRKT